MRELVVLEQAANSLVTRGPPFYLIGYPVSGREVERFIAVEITRRRPSRTGRFGYISHKQLKDFSRIKLMRPPFARNWLGFNGEKIERRFSPHLELYGPDLQKFISSLKIAVVGLGRSGSEVVLNLLKEGFRNFLLIDKDVVEERNKHLTTYARAMEGIPKAEALKAFIHENFYDVVVTSLLRDVVEILASRKASLLVDADIIFCAVDEAPARAALNAFCSQAGIPLIEIGTSITPKEALPDISGRITVSIPGRNCLFCMGLLTEEDINTNEKALYGDSTFSSLMASEAVMTLKEFLIGSPNFNTKYVSMESITPRKEPPAPTCPICRPSVEQLERAKAIGNEKSSFNPLIPLLILGLPLLATGIWALISVPFFKESLMAAFTFWFMKNRRKIFEPGGERDG